MAAYETDSYLEYPRKMMFLASIAGVLMEMAICSGIVSFSHL